MARPKKDRQPARLTVTLDETDYRQVCTLAEENDVSAAWIIRRAVHDYLERGESPASRLDADSASSKQRKA